MLSTVETDAGRLRRKNVKALRLSIKESERLAKEKQETATKAARLAKEQARTARCSGIIPSTSSSGTTSNDHHHPSAGAAYTEEYYLHSCDRKGKGQARKW